MKFTEKQEKDMKKYILSFLAAIILTACAGENVTENSAAEEKFYDKNSVMATDIILSENVSEIGNSFQNNEDTVQKNSDVQKGIKLEKPKIEIEKYNDNSVEIKIKNLSENVEKIRVYRLSASDEDPQNVKRVLQKEILKGEIENEKVIVFADEKISEDTYSIPPKKVSVEMRIPCCPRKSIFKLYVSILIYFTCQCRLLDYFSSANGGGKII